MVTLVDSLDIKLDKLSNLDHNWVTFIIDHIPNIIADSTKSEITAADKDRFKFKVDHLLRDRDVNQSIRWIIKLVNGLTMYETLQTKEFIYLIDKSYITNLYRKYRTSTKVTT